MESRPKIAILGTGGTLASIACSRLSSHYDAAAIPIAALIADLPEINDIADIHCEQIAQINSEHMTEALWLRLARRIRQLLLEENFNAVVVAHGTDTMSETAYFINLVIPSDKAIVFTGAMRPANAVSADGLRNLYNAVILACDAEAKNKGVLVTLNDKIFAARDVIKNDVNTTASFSAGELGILGSLQDNHVHFYRTPTKRHTHTSEFDIQAIQALPKVAIILAYVGSNEALVNACVRDKAQGIISAGVGLGYQSNATTNALIKASEQGVMVVRCSRVNNAIIMRDSNDDQHQFVVSKMLVAQKARILLAVALTQYQDYQTIQRIFDEY